jgi:hypothetical protein
VFNFSLFAFCFSLLSGCAGNLPPVSDHATIMVWRSMPGLGPRTNAQLIAADLRQDRDLFLRFYRDARDVGVSDPLALEEANAMRGLMIVAFFDRGVTRELHLFQARGGTPLTIGHGPINLDTNPASAPEYRYRRRDVEALKAWLEKQAPAPPPGRSTPPRPDIPRLR